VRRGPVRPLSKRGPDLALRHFSKHPGAAGNDIEEFDGARPDANGESDAPATPGRSRDRSLPQFLPNKFLDVMAAATEQTDTARLERRIFRLGIVTMAMVLAAIVVGVIGLAVLSGGRVSGPAAASGASTIAPVKTPDAADWAARSERARTVAREFFDSTDPGRKRELILDGEFEAAALRRHHEVTGGREPGRPLLDQARAVLSGERMVFLVPVETEGGGVRVAAVVETAQGFFLDWRSAVTPETMTWSEFLSRRPTDPASFRVAITAAPAAENVESEWRMYRLERSDGAIIGAARAGSRVADDIERLKTAAGGRPASADLHLCFDPSLPSPEMVRIAGITPEKWNL
jgi:hypothetical protein